MQTHLEGLNPAQKEAVETIKGPLLIVAGAGAGKTKTLTSRIIHIILSGVHSEKILAITFTNKAAGEMRDRVRNAISQRHIEGMPFVTTFHRLGGTIIRENAQAFGLTKHFSIFDEDDTRSVIRSIMKELDINPKALDPGKVKAVISRSKMAGRTPQELESGAYSDTENLSARIWVKYEQALQKSGGLDFDDLIVKAVRLLEKDEKIKEYYRKRFTYVHVDEFQDTNEMEYRLVKLLVGEERNLCVVGDTDQNIYGWRGAKIKNMLHFEKDFPGTKSILLEQNYRSTGRILESANAIIEKNTVRVPKNLFTDKTKGDKILSYEAFDEKDEAVFVVRECKDLIASGVPAEEIAVLFRANFQSRVLEEAFLLGEVPYRVIGTHFFQRAEVKDIISYIRAALNRESIADVKRSIAKPRRGIGDASVAKLFSGKADEIKGKTRVALVAFNETLDRIKDATQTLTPSKLIRFVLDESGLIDTYKDEGERGYERIENVGELATLASIYDTLPLGEGAQSFLEDAALRSDQDALEDAPEGVRLLTVHASKGLEFKVVFIVGLEEGLFPHDRASRAPRIEDAEEERRLFYVALTRAKEKVYLTHAQARTIFGSRTITTPSEFIYDIPEEHIDIHSDTPKSLPSIFF